MIGEVCAGYRLTQKLGEGGTGETYLAEHQETGQQAAVKVLFKGLCEDTAQVEQFIADVQAASRINHIGIADIHDAGVHGNGRAFVVGEYLQGKSLTDAMIELGQVSDMASFADIAWQLATMLAAAHAAQMVHAALKPDGIFLTFPPAQTPRPLVKLIDFGMAKFTLGVRHSQTGSLLGAPLYMSPEIGRGLGRADHRADIYSLGCILFEMACGRPPFVREGRGELIIAHATESPPPVTELEPSFPAQVGTLIGRMLTKQPATRPQSMGEIALVLEKFFDCPAPGISSSTPAPAPPSFSAATPSVAPANAISSPVPAVPVAAPPLAEARVPAMVASTGAEVRPFDPPHPGARPNEASFQRQRIHDPTALIDRPVQAWVAKVHQRTTMLDASDVSIPRMAIPAPGAIVQSRRSSRDRAVSSQHKASAVPAPVSGINLPLVIASAVVVLVVGAIIIVLVQRRPHERAEPARTSAPEASSVFVPPPPPTPAAPLLEQPKLPPVAPPVPVARHRPSPPPRQHVPARPAPSRTVEPESSSEAQTPRRAKHW
jgi:serine/threonine protein kinase